MTEKGEEAERAAHTKEDSAHGDSAPATAPAPAPVVAAPTPRKRERDESPISLAIPKATIKRIMKLGEENPAKFSGEAVSLVGKATELFLEQFARSCMGVASRDGRKAIKYADVSEIQAADPNLIFLEMVVPRPGTPGHPS
ncbi:unnamed protein product [Phaeothamnion confervicola]